MKPFSWSSLRNKLATASMGFASAISLVVMLGTAFPGIALAQPAPPPPISPPCETGNRTGVVEHAPDAVTAPYGTGSTLQGPESITDASTVAPCKTFEFQQSLIQTLLGALRSALIMAIINTAQRFTQTIAMQTAEWAAHGFHGEGPIWYQKGFQQFLEDVGGEVVDQMINEFNENYMKKQLGFSLCDRPLINFKLMLGLGRIKPFPPPSCTLQKLKENFDAVKNGLDGDEMMKTLKNSVVRGGNDIALASSINFLKLNKVYSAREAAQLDRQEGGGFKLLTDVVDGRIKVPADVVRQKLREENPSALARDQQRTFAEVTGLAALNAGFADLPRLAAVTFLNTLANSLLDQLFAWLQAGPDTELTPVNLDYPDATPGVDVVGAGPDVSQDLPPGTEPPVVTGSEDMGVGGTGNKSGISVTAALSDILSANVFTTDQEDLLLEMSTCLQPRGLWGCTIDQDFMNGLRQRTKLGAATVARAAGLGGSQGFKPFLHLDWQMIPDSESKDNQDKGCYQRAYCAANLAKLRFARILPVGWELAANSPFNKKLNGKFVTLETVMRGYNACNKDGLADADHPWCKLINPAWVLIAPPIQCNVKGFGSSVLDPAAPSRIQECSELVSCVQTDDKGKCIGGYGACLSDKTVWRFGGTACEEKFVSCRAYRTRLGQDASYIRNSIDYGSCNSTNVGCLMYAITRDVATTTADVWLDATKTDFLPGAPTDTGYVFTGPRIYLDAKAQSCSASDDGCTKLYRLQEGETALNLIRNSSFEANDAAASTLLDSWNNDLTGLSETDPAISFVFKPAEGANTIDGAQALYGSRAAYFWDKGVTKALYQLADMQPLRNYTVSYYARRIDKTADAAVTLRFRLLKTKGAVEAYTDGPGTFYRSINCTAETSQPALANAQFRLPASITAGNLSDDWQRYTCEFVSNPGTVQGRLKFSAYNTAVEGVMLEESPFVTGYVDGENTGLDVVHAKIAPEELACSGDATKDRKECAKYARVCQQADMGCKGYREANGVSQVEIPAKLTPADYCPSSCAGYADYRKLPSTFDLVNTGAADPSSDPLDDPSDDTVASFVPERAQACEAADVGCEEFTSLETSASGGETKAYYSYGRACRKPTDAGAVADTYFSWEGSDTTGYQLKTWALLKSDPASIVPVAPKILRKAGPDGIVKDPATCTDTSWKAGTDLDCRQFYDSTGKAYYVYFSQTIVSTVDCVDYRKNGSSGDDCSKTGGDFEQGTGNCVYHILPNASNSCTVEAAGCRAYIGAGGRDSAIILRDTFTELGKSFASADGTTKASLSDESLLVGDKSLKVENIAASGVGTVVADVPSATDTLYLISFWLKTTNTKPPAGQLLVNGKAVATFAMPVDWERVELGPFRGENSLMQIKLILPHTTFIDEAQVTAIQDTYYVKKGSWVIPAECDVTPEGVPQPKAMLGCREYRDRNGETAFAYRFSRLCRAESIGCTGFIDTRNSDSPYAQTFVMSGVKNYDPTSPNFKPWDSIYTGTVTTTRAADRYIYVIDEPASRCDASAESCRAFGKVEFDTYGKPTSTVTVYLKDDVSKYLDQTGEPDMLCRPSDLFCESYTTQLEGSQQLTSYFRNPNKHVCVWKERVKLDDNLPYYSKGEYDGWFAAGTTPPVPCYPEKLSKGNTFLAEFSGSLNYRGWTQACPRDQGECTMFQDPNDKTNLEYPEGRPYFFLNNSRIDKQSCSGNVDPLSGCVLLRDSTSTLMTYSSAATYAKSHREGDNPVTPVDCSLPGQTDPTCVAGAKNDANLVVRIKLDRDCATWLGCQSGETVFDAVQGKYVDLCSTYAVCDKVGSANSQYCGEFIDRRPPGVASTSTGYQEPVLRAGRVVDQNAYALRPEAYTDPDYSGYTQPNTFQLVDLVTRPVGYDILNRFPEFIKLKFARDYRLVAAVPIFGTPFADLPGQTPADPAQHGILKLAVTKAEKCDPADWACLLRVMDIEAANKVAPKTIAIVGKINKSAGAPFVDPVVAAQPTGDPAYYAEYLQPDPQFPYLNLCRHVQTGLVGYYLKSDNPRLCYFSVDKPPSAVASDIYTTSTVNIRNAQNAAGLFMQLRNTDVKLDPLLNSAYPPAECKAYPASDAPFPNQFVKSWDANGKPYEYATGYDNVPYCEKGQDCDCTYRKASYGGLNKFYSPFGPAPLGVCTGGANEGVPCSPYQTDLEKSLNPVCGSGSQCTALQKSTLVQGLLGQCLQRDLTRTIAGSQNFNPCLVWNPLLGLRGPADVHHYSFSAGYVQNPTSGEYYCVSNMAAPKQIKMLNSPWFNSTLVNSNVFPPACPFVPGGIADKQQWLYVGDPLGGDDTKSYREYFVRFNQTEWAKTLTNSTDTNAQLATLETKNFTQFKFDVGNVSSTCGAPLFDNKPRLFAREFDNGKNYIDVTDMQLLVDRDTGDPTKLPCMYAKNAFGGDCYYKYADMGYQAEGQETFTMMDDSSGGVRPLVQGGNPVYRAPYVIKKARSSKPYFAIRAMFENARDDENAIPSVVLSPDGHELNGPWRFVGFWVTVSEGNTASDLRGLLMTLTVLNAPICNEVAQVISPGTRDSAAFMDRIWKEGKYREPVLGYTNNDDSLPFGSVPNSLPIGKDPLFHPAVSLVSRSDVGTQRSFPGGPYVVYANDSDQPSQNWGWLTDLFARIYRIYRFYDIPVTKTSWACLSGPRFGSWCPNLAEYYDVAREQDVFVENTPNNSPLAVQEAGLQESRKYCGYDGVCQPFAGAEVARAQPRCNALSGVNSGLPCSGQRNDDIAGYAVCHSAPVKRIQGNLVPLYTSCELRNEYCTGNKAVHCSSDGDCAAKGAGKCVIYRPIKGGLFQDNAVPPNRLDQGALGKKGDILCASNAVKYPNGQTANCTQIASLSKQCPMEIDPGPDGDSQCVNNHCIGGFEHASCNTDKDCEFTWFEWWNNGTDSPTPYCNGDAANPGCKFGTGGTVLLNSAQIHPTLIINGEVQSDVVSTAPHTPELDLDPAFTKGAILPGQPQTEVIGTASNVNWPFIDRRLTVKYLGLDPKMSDGTSTRYQWWSDKDPDANKLTTVPATDLFGNPLADSVMQKDIGNSNVGAGGSDGFGRYAVMSSSTSFLKRFPGAYIALPLGYTAPAGPVVKSATWNGKLPGGMLLPPNVLDKGINPLTGKRGVQELHQFGGCTVDKDCAWKSARAVCQGGNCVEPPCVTNADCGVNMLCSSGTCIDDPNALKQVPEDLGVYIPGHCERPPVTDKNFLNLPYEHNRFILNKVSNAAVQSHWKPWTPGSCVGGAYQGRTCIEDGECVANNVSLEEKAKAGLYCQPVTGPDNKPRSITFTVTSTVYTFNCVDPGGDSKSTDPDKDDNLCTHGIGYYPRADLCGGSQNKSDCLLAMAHGDGSSADVNHSNLPTDVTDGLYSPTYIGGRFSTGKFNPMGDIDDRYASFYVPRPPTIAAPDTARKCAAPGKCPINAVNAFTFENQSDGLISYGGGQVRTDIKFYAWAADDQGPIKTVRVDWGDGGNQAIEDTNMKNRKPICDKPKECQFIPGLACGSDNDCPPAGGKCIDIGFCTKRPNIRCTRNEDCTVGNTLIDTCTTRTTFGNSKDACDESFYNFSHIYNCGPEQQKTLPLCGTQLRCSRDPNRNCVTNNDCAPGDACADNLAPSGGCYDAQRADCRFTPRVMVIDNWGWCTGECRLEQLQTAKAGVVGGTRMGDAFSVTQNLQNRGIANFMLFQNGGCYDGSHATYNDTFGTSFAVGSSTRSDASGNEVMSGGVPDIQAYQNACDPNIRGAHFRPWIVYQGALQLGVGKK